MGKQRERCERCIENFLKNNRLYKFLILFSFRNCVEQFTRVVVGKYLYYLFVTKVKPTVQHNINKGIDGPRPSVRRLGVVGAASALLEASISSISIFCHSNHDFAPKNVVIRKMIKYITPSEPIAPKVVPIASAITSLRAKTASKASSFRHVRCGLSILLMRAPLIPILALSTRTCLVIRRN